MKQMNFETFIHRVAMEFGTYLPKSYAGYETVVKCERREGNKNARMTLEKENVEWMREVELYSYFLKYTKGMQMELLLCEMAEDLLHPNTKKSPKKKHTRHIYRMIVVGIGSAIVGVALVSKIGKSRRIKDAV